MTTGRKALLLNASNMETYPVYPYAFIQVPAIARRAGIEVRCKELLGIPRERWAQTVGALIERHDPAMILVTLRNTDSMIPDDYEQDGSGEGGGRAYFPIERTRELMAAIRAVSDLKIAVGGFGFGILPEEIMDYLRPDYGVVGGPDGFFAHFEDVQAGNPGEAANLLYFRGDQLVANPRVFYPPLADTEYTPEAIKEMMAFYDAFPSPGLEGAPVEVMRGCCHSCVFCCEPHVAGKVVRYRDLAAVMADIEMLAGHGVRQIYAISSELNPEGNAFALQLASRIEAFNEGQAADRRVTWFGANFLLRFSSEEYERLYRSGFTGGWFDTTALDDENARAMRTPYRNERLLGDLKIHARCKTAYLERVPADQPQAGKAAPEETTDGEKAGGQDGGVRWTMFLGNPATTTETIRNTLRFANREGLAQLFRGCSIISYIRVFDYEEPDEATLAVTYSVDADLTRSSYRQMLPSFAYAPALLRDFGSGEAIETMFKHVAETYLSTRYEESRDWLGFVREKAGAASMAQWLAALADREGIQVPAHLRPGVKGEAATALQGLFSGESQEDGEDAREKLAGEVVDALLAGCLAVIPEPFEALGLPATMDELERMTPYELAVAVYRRWSTEAEMVEELSERAGPALGGSTEGLVRFCVQAMLHRLNVVVDPKYRGLFVAVG